MELEIENTEVVSANSIQIEAPGSVEVIEGEKDYKVSVVKKEYTIIGDSIFIPSMYEDAPPWLKEFISTTLEVAIINRDQSLIDRMEAILTLMDYVPKNQYTEQINQIVSEDGIINSRIATLNSNLTDAISSTNAIVAEINLTYASKNEAAAIATNVITASLSGNGEIGSALIELQEAYANLESTTAQSINMLESVMEGEINGNSRAMETIRTYVGIDEAGASTHTGLSAYLEASDGTIGGVDSQLANTIRVTAEGVESKFAYNSIVNINGVYKKSGFGLTTNYTSGNGTEANPYVSEFWIDASRLKFTNSNQTGQTAPFTIDATGTSPQITFNGKVTFSNVTDVPSFDSGSNNLLTNSAPTLGNETYGWQVYWYNTNIVPNAVAAGFDIWRPTGAGSVYVVVGGAPTVGTVFDIGQSNNIPVVAGKRYEISALLSSHRCTSQCTLAFFNSAGTYISEIGAGSANSVSYSGNLSNWVRQGGFVTVPAGTSYARFYIRSTVTGTDPYCFVAQAYMGEVSAGRTEFSTWSEGASANSKISWQSEVQAAINNNATYIDGGKIVTGSIAAGKINTTGLIAENISANEIVGKTISGGVINGARINGAVIKASYLDLDGELEVLTNYHISVATRNANPSLYTDAVYISADNEYRIPSLSTIRESTSSANISAVGSVFNSNIRSYNTANAGHNNKCVKSITSILVSTNIHILTITNPSQPPYEPFTFSSNSIKIYIGGIDIGLTAQFVTTQIPANYDAEGFGSAQFNDAYWLLNGSRVTSITINRFTFITSGNQLYLASGNYNMLANFTNTTVGLIYLINIGGWNVKWHGQEYTSAYAVHVSAAQSTNIAYMSTNITINNMI